MRIRSSLDGLDDLSEEGGISLLDDGVDRRQLGGGVHLEGGLGRGRQQQRHKRSVALAGDMDGSMYHMIRIMCARLRDSPALKSWFRIMACHGYLIAPSVDGDVEDGLREPLCGGVLVRGVEAVVGDGVAEYAELPALKGGQCGLLEEMIL